MNNKTNIVVHIFMEEKEEKCKILRFSTNFSLWVKSQTEKSKAPITSSCLRLRHWMNYFVNPAFSSSARFSWIQLILFNDLFHLSSFQFHQRCFH